MPRSELFFKGLFCNGNLPTLQMRVAFWSCFLWIFSESHGNDQSMLKRDV